MATKVKDFEDVAHSNLTEREGMSTGPVPIAPYHSRAFFEREAAQIFGRAWLLVARVEEIPEPGSFVVKDISPTKANALITRSASGRIQAFHNTCSHRGSQIVYETEGRQNRFTCPYHAWTYKNDGELLAVPDESNFFDFDKKNCGLTKIHTEVWEGWVFINLQAQPEVSLKEFLGDFAPYFEGYEYLGADSPVVFEIELDANWKVASDAFIETYHIAAIHPGTLKDGFTSPNNPWGRLLDAKLYGAHRTVSMYGNPNYKTDPKHRVEAFAAGLGETGNVISAATKAETAKYLSHQAVNPGKVPPWSMDVNHIFPHVHIDSGPGGFWVHWFWPLSENRTRYEGRFYMSEAQGFAARMIQELYVSRVVTAICEDITSMQRTQRGLESGGKTHMILQDSEFGIRHNVEQCIKWVEAATVKEALS